MTDEKDPKDTAPAEGSPGAEPKAEAAAEAKPAEVKAEAPAEAKAEAKSEAPTETKTRSTPPAAAAKPGDPAGLAPPASGDPPKSHPKPSVPHAENVRMPTPGVRVRLAYEEGSGHITAPSDAKTGLRARRLVAEYDTTAGVLHAAETLRDAGYKAFDAHSPFPVHGMDAAMGLPDSRLGWIVLTCGLTGVSCAWLMMYWMNGVDYPLIIGGKPPGTLPSMVPIMFELTVLLSAFGAVLGMFGLNRLPQHHDLLFYSDRFAAFSNDKFFISVENQDPKFDVQTTQALLEKTHPVTIEVIETLEEVES
jgi:hypothetical protein